MATKILKVKKNVPVFYKNKKNVSRSVPPDVAHDFFCPWRLKVFSGY